MTGASDLEYVAIAIDHFATGQQLVAKNRIPETKQETLTHCAEGKLAKHALVAQLFLGSAANQGDKFRRRKGLLVLDDDDEFRVAEKLDGAVRLLPGGLVACQAACKDYRLEARAEALRTPAPHGVANTGLRVRVAGSGGKCHTTRSGMAAWHLPSGVGHFVQLATACGASPL